MGNFWSTHSLNRKRKSLLFLCLSVASVVFLSQPETALAVDLPSPSVIGSSCVGTYSGTEYMTFNWYAYSNGQMSEGSNNFQNAFNEFYFKPTGSSTWTYISGGSFTFDNRSSRDPNGCDGIANVVSASYTPDPNLGDGTFAEVVFGGIFGVSTTTFFWELEGGEMIPLGGEGDLSCNELEDTRILNLIPENGTTTLSNDVDFELEMCVSEEDVGVIQSVRVKLTNIDQNVLLVSLLSPSTIEFLDVNISDSGYFSYATTAVIADGNYRIEACFRNSYLLSWITNPFSQTCQSNQFTVVAGSFIGTMTQDMWGSINQSFSSSTATSTQALATSCNPLGGSFSITNCTLFLFIPDPEHIKTSMLYVLDIIKVHFPLGYINDFLSIMNSGTTTPLVVIDAELPTALRMGTGHHITLDLTGVLDPILNATTSVFLNASAPSDETLFEITYPYYQKLILILTLLYILARVLGSHIIPQHNMFGRQGALSDTGSNDDSYRLKEWLYNKRE